MKRTDADINIIIDQVDTYSKEGLCSHDASKKAEVSDSSYYKWRKQLGFKKHGARVDASQSVVLRQEQEIGASRLETSAILEGLLNTKLFGVILSLYLMTKFSDYLAKYQII